MSLVAYAASSDEESENEDDNTGPQVELLKPQSKPNTTGKTALPVQETPFNGHISDEDDDYVPQEASLQQLKTPSGRLSLALPKPKVAFEEIQEEDVDEQVTLPFAKLPLPRAAAVGKAVIEEKDDEFLHKKAVPNRGDALEKPPPPPVKERVKISIPSLRDFSDVDKEKAEKSKNKDNKANMPKGCGLLSLLPQAKSERNFAKSSAAEAPQLATGTSNAPKSTNTMSQSRAAAPAFVPDTVKHRRAAHNTEGVDGVKSSAKKPSPNAQGTGAVKKQQKKPSAALVNASDSEEDDDDEAGDFFSLNTEQKLPEVSSNEISALVAKRAAKMVEASGKYLDEMAARNAVEAAEAEAARLQDEQMHIAQKRYHEHQLDPEAMDALVGKNAKRRRKETKDIQVIDIAGSQVLPDREEWMRTALTSSTTFQPTGVLTDDEPVAGTRRKHQITYLAHKAKANEAELQAMWSANRQTRRATQSKYGF
ncbi:LOW QUALITY PROTEIN: proline-rich protein PRCC [Drosophila obscura]|uniref:LOW QUALITY PROTEIN: proline-rich protein PRCC n=1 Tax=Drosophila obscura TaxID=7282 RepID=UPI001BB266C7|nr:LOW QUALITY PROTEIN: proline-rich protein PRCC [Drosophila obscura]